MSPELKIDMQELEAARWAEFIRGVPAFGEQMEEVKKVVRSAFKAGFTFGYSAGGKAGARRMAEKIKGK